MQDVASNRQPKTDEVLRKSPETIWFQGFFSGAGYEARTRYLHLGKVALYQMS
ncbi:hypothetical protein ANACOL_00716 [Anaerotruncus colihominis DSM 17241]|uniref:Uncharacterized protein n=1 Tax=Anaerotruncus colihominis DSM 17241 TaxID=445972 RepID=B0P7I5_9FIRM|nr:hypothetical protein ANACOL_00716 [Anaerotruncus colihominis DSM 17241]